jgi:hypothetical protein
MMAQKRSIAAVARRKGSAFNANAQDEIGGGSFMP